MCAFNLKAFTEFVCVRSGPVGEAIANGKAFVRLTHSSPLVMADFIANRRKYQEDVNNPLPQQPADHRWNLLQQMCTGLSKSKKSVLATVNAYNHDHPQNQLKLNGADFAIFDGISPSLEKMRQTCELLEGSNYVAISLAADALLQLRSKVIDDAAKAGGDTPVAKFLKSLLAEIDERFNDWPRAVLLAMLLDPRIKDTNMTADQQRDAWGFLADEVKKRAPESKRSKPAAESKSDASSSSSNSNSNSNSKEMDLELDPALADIPEADLAAILGPKMETRVPALEDEIARYKRAALLDRRAAPLAWWRGRKDDFPNLRALAKRYLAIQPSSAAVERVFSTGGNTVSKRRASLAKDTIEELILCHDNQDLVQKKL